VARFRDLTPPEVSDLWTSGSASSPTCRPHRTRTHTHTQHTQHDTHADLLFACRLTSCLGAAQRIGEVVERHYKADALTMAIQDGAAAGQTVSTHARALGLASSAQPCHLTVIDVCCVPLCRARVRVQATCTFM